MTRDLRPALAESIEEPGPAHRSGFCVGGVTVHVAGDYSADVALDVSLRPFCIDAGVPDVTVQVGWAATLAPAPGRKLFDSGSIWRVYEDGAGLQFDFSTAFLGERPYKRLCVDRSFRRATLQMNEECFPGAACVTSSFEYPLDELLIMHRLTQERAIELHGVGIAGPDGANNLFVGHSGAGKSTTARLWTSLHKVEILSDDRVIVREEKYPEENASGRAPQIFMYGTPWHGEAHFALSQRAPLQRIFILEHGFDNVITPLSPIQAVSELFARSFVPFHRHEYVHHALSFLEHVTHSIPCYRYSFEPDQRAVDKILQFHD